MIRLAVKFLTVCISLVAGVSPAEARCLLFPTHNLSNACREMVCQTDSGGRVGYEVPSGAFGSHGVECGTAVGRQRTNTKDEDPDGLTGQNLTNDVGRAALVGAALGARFATLGNAYVGVREGFREGAALTNATARAIQAASATASEAAGAAESASVKYNDRMEGLKGIPRAQTPLDDLPNLGSPGANYYQNSSVLRKALRDGFEIRDASAFRLNSEPAPTPDWPTRTVGQTFTGAERLILDNKGLKLSSSGTYVPK